SEVIEVRNFSEFSSSTLNILLLLVFNSNNLPKRYFISLKKSSSLSVLKDAIKCTFKFSNSGFEFKKSNRNSTLTRVVYISFKNSKSSFSKIAKSDSGKLKITLKSTNFSKLESDVLSKF